MHVTIPIYGSVLECEPLPLGHEFAGVVSAVGSDV